MMRLESKMKGSLTGAKLPPCLFALIAATACVPDHHRIGGDIYTKEKLTQEEDLARAACLSRKQDPDKVPASTFTTDGCSLFPDGTWQRCCVEHDKVYWCGGTAEERKQADRQLRQCVQASGHSYAGALMYPGTRAGGHPLWPVPWRWGYGWAWPRSYERR